MSDLSKIPVTVITGFLGVWQNHADPPPDGQPAGQASGRFWSMNLARSGVDGDILKSCADESCPVENIVELANGCICCTVADEFIPTIEALLALPQRPDHILIETSGLALPKPLLKAFDWPAHPLA